VRGAGPGADGGDSAGSAGVLRVGYLGDGADSGRVAKNGGTLQKAKLMASQKMQIYRGERGGNPFITKDFLRDLRGEKALLRLRHN
jgi:hypothetical protein